jgi:hypothetical protein
MTRLGGPYARICWSFELFLVTAPAGLLFGNLFVVDLPDVQPDAPYNVRLHLGVPDHVSEAVYPAGGGSAFPDHALAEPIPRGQWVRIVLELALDANPAKATIYVDGRAMFRAGEGGLHALAGPGDVLVSVGAYRGQTSYEFFVDDVVVRAQ